MFGDHEKLDYLDSHLQYIIHEGDYPYLEFKSPDLNGTVHYDMATDTFIIRGKSPMNKTIKYVAANPLWKNYSYAGSGLPYPNYESAYENTINQGTVNLNQGEFIIKVAHPSEYYVNLGKTLLKPHIHLKLLEQNKLITLVIADFMPYRSLKNLPYQPNRTTGR